MGPKPGVARPTAWQECHEDGGPQKVYRYRVPSRWKGKSPSVGKVVFSFIVRSIVVSGLCIYPVCAWIGQRVGCPVEIDWALDIMSSLVPKKWPQQITSRGWAGSGFQGPRPRRTRSNSRLRSAGDSSRREKMPFTVVDKSSGSLLEAG